MRIALCDDVHADLELLSNMLNQYKERTSIDMEIAIFGRSVDVLAAMRGGASFDLIFFDILMPGLSGIEASKMLRETNADTQLVFTTISRDFAIDAFAVKARDYLLKPINELTLFALLDDIGLAKEKKRSIVISVKDGFRKIPIHELTYCEIFGHTVLWHLSSGAVAKSIGTMRKTMDLLDDRGYFFRIHRAFLVNFAYISEFHRSDSTVELNNMCRLPIPRARFMEVLEAYKKYVAQGGGVE